MTTRRFLSISLMVLSVCIAPELPAQSMPPAAYAGPRRIDLSGTWDFKLDPDRTGEKDRWFASGTAAKQDAWGQLAVPGSYNEQLATSPGLPQASDKMRFLHGVAWYRTTFATPDAAAAGRCFLHLSGTVLRHTVWLNGQLVSHGDRPYLEEAYDVTALLMNDRPNLLVVEVDNKIPDFGIPDIYWHGWWDDGGLIRPVYLELRPVVHGESHVATKKTANKAWELDIETHIAKPEPAKPVAISWKLTGVTGRVVWNRTETSPDSAFKIAIKLSGIQPWSPESPSLYTLTTTIADGASTDETSIHVGFRQIAVRGTQVLLNGQPYVIRGLSRHQFLAGAGMSLTVAQDRKDIADIKALGANFVRLAHYTQSQDVYDACDELGLLVWTEIPAWQSRIESLTDPTIWETSAKPQLEGMVAQHRDHPSVVIWSVGNEIPTEKLSGADYVARAIDYVKSLDNTRLVTFASDRRLGDKAFGSVDIIAINEYFGWYYGQQDEVGSMLDKMHERFAGKPILVSEFGQDGVANWDRATAQAGSRDYSYDAETAFLNRHLEQIFSPKRRSFIAGALIWVYNDFPDPHRIGGDHPVAANYRNNKGLVTMDRTHKPAYDAVQEFFHAQPVQSPAP